MKFLSKLFGKGSGDENSGQDSGATPPPADEAPPRQESPASEESTPDDVPLAPDDVPLASEVEHDPEVVAAEEAQLSAQASAAPAEEVAFPEESAPWEQEASPSAEESGPEAAADAPAEVAPGDEWSALRRQLRDVPDSHEHHDAVRRAIPLLADRVDFYLELVESDPEVPRHALSLGRTLQSARRPQEAVPHFQRYLRSSMDAEVFDELAGVYEQAGQAYMASSARQIAESIRSKGVPCSNS